MDYCFLAIMPVTRQTDSVEYYVNCTRVNHTKFLDKKYNYINNNLYEITNEIIPE